MPRQPTIILVDTSVIAHGIAHSLEAIKDKPRDLLEQAVLANIQWILSGEWLGQLRPKDLRFIWVYDHKDAKGEYWRHSYLRKPEVVASIPQRTKAKEKKRLALLDAIESKDAKVPELAKELEVSYKAGRSFPSPLLSFVKNQIRKALDLVGQVQLGEKGYEADDMAALVVKVNNDLASPYNIILLTVDSDWMGLINAHVSWFCSSGYSPRLRYDMYHINEWSERRLGVKLETPSDIWAVKSQQGDKSDNIPASAGVLMPIIDLLNPCPEYDLYTTWYKRILSTLDGLTAEEFSAVDAENFIYSLGLRFAVRAFSTNKDI
jgi:hypothetical protein